MRGLGDLAQAGLTAAIAILTWLAVMLNKRTKAIPALSQTVDRTLNNVEPGEPSMPAQVRDLRARLDRIEASHDARFDRIEGRLDLLIRRQLEDRKP